jgi:sulfur-oxidizing protein SoxX
MLTPLRVLISAAGMVVLVGAVVAVPLKTPAAETPTPSLAQEGKQIAFERSKGNCLACHVIAGGDSPGDIGPPLVAMKARYPDKAKLRAQIYDATVANPQTVMPPFGRNRILTEDEIDKLVDFIYTL